MTAHPERDRAIVAAQRIAVAFPRRINAPPHEVASLHSLTRKLAALLGCEFIEDYDPVIRPGVGGVYYVPARTLVGAPNDIRGDHDLFGGVVPKAFVGTKAITHSLFDARARAPAGWSSEFGDRVRSAVLNGVTVFSIGDARRAGAALLRTGPLRVKPVEATAGRGQLLVETPAALEIAIEGQNSALLGECGLVLEEHLDDVETFSVGRVCVGEQVATYVGTQSLTRDNAGDMVYGGSELFFARGDYDELLKSDLSDAEREAVRLSRIYDAAALECYPGLYASRRNYDVARGKNAHGQIRTGVLEQSWRAGGASLAEVYALEAFQQDPDLHTLRAYTCERYGPGQSAPPSAHLIYQGEDAETGFITKFGGVSSYGGT